MKRIEWCQLCGDNDVATVTVQLHPDHTPVLRNESMPDNIRVCGMCEKEIMAHRRRIIDLNAGTLFKSVD